MSSGISWQYICYQHMLCLVSLSLTLKISNLLICFNEWEHFRVKLEQRLNWGGIFPSEVFEIRNYKWLEFWVVGGRLGGCTWIIASALLLFSLNWDFEYRNLSSEEQEPSVKIIIFGLAIVTWRQAESEFLYQTSLLVLHSLIKLKFCYCKFVNKLHL